MAPSAAGGDWKVYVLDGANGTVLFTITGAPGDYRLAATSDPDLSDPDMLDRLATAAEKITLARSAKETRQLELR